MVIDIEEILWQIRALLYSMAPVPHSGIYSAPESHFYDIEEVKVSESAWVLFTRQSNSREEVVMKVLRDYKDDRYSLKERAERHRCQVKAVKVNRAITRGVHQGLARINDIYVDQRRISIGPLIEEPVEGNLDETGEYALLMRKLPEDRCLERLLSVDKMNCRGYVERLVEYIVELHKRQQKHPLVSEEEITWGSFEQLAEKLETNIAFAGSVLLQHGKDMYSLLRDTLREAVVDRNYQDYFEQRRKGEHIRSCHGDLKAPNIWITPYYDSRKKMKRTTVKLIDAIDFNILFSNIDFLSDFAMFVVDIQARTRSDEIAYDMIDTYLGLTGQQNETARAVLAYYLVEKAMISAAISIEHDQAYGLGEKFLAVGTMWRDEVTKFMTIRR